MADIIDARLHESFNVPVKSAAALTEEVFHELESVDGVGDLRVELKSENFSFEVLNGSYWAVGSGSSDFESIGNFGNGVTVAHPHDFGVSEAVVEGGFKRFCNAGDAILFNFARFYLSAESLADELMTIADA